MISTELHSFYSHPMVDFAFRKMFRSIEHDETLPLDSWARNPMNEGPLTIARLYGPDREVYQHQVELRRPELEILMIEWDKRRPPLWEEPLPEEAAVVEPLPVLHYRLRTGMAEMAISVSQLYEAGAWHHAPPHMEVELEFEIVRFRALRYWLDDPEVDCGCQG